MTYYLLHGLIFTCTEHITEYLLTQSSKYENEAYVEEEWSSNGEEWHAKLSELLKEGYDLWI